MSPGLQNPVRARHLAAALVLAVAAGSALADDYADVARLLRAGQSAEALARADRYLAASPRDPQMRFLKGVALGDAGRSAEALEVLTRLVEEYPELPEPHNNLAVLHAARGDLDKARSALEAALRVNPSYATAHENLGDVYLGLAARAWERAQQLEPGLARSVAPKLAAARSLAR
ncbi:tetratricopeptide repeat protein [Ramlibacter sp. MAHUQ-53]|uniref:tetratricopeptide repeat protein n=1 Tax=unclassified Ramlibacter TaxID=2617605 RepID=UPI003636C043